MKRRDKKIGARIWTSSTAETQKAFEAAAEHLGRTAGAPVIVTHPKYGEVRVRHRSNFSAIKNAARAWGVDWTEIRDAEIRTDTAASPAGQ